MENDKSQDLRSDSAGWRLTRVDGAFLMASQGQGPSLSAVRQKKLSYSGQSALLFVLFRPSAIDQGPPPLGRKSALHNLLILNINFIKKNEFESVAVRSMNLEPVLQSEVSQKEKTKYCILTHVYVI